MTRRFLVTGATKGIGLAASQRLAAAGHDVVGMARSAVDGFPGELITVDLADEGATAAALERLVAGGRVDGVVNNVGLVRPAPVGSVSLDDLRAVLDVNLRVTVQVTQALLPGMREAGWGRIVNVSSLVALGAVDRTAYAGAKGAVISITRDWAVELAPAGITVNAVAPGPVETELFRENNPLGSERERAYLAIVPLGRFGRPDEVGAAIAFLCSDDAAWITGQILHVDGGSSLGHVPV